MNDAVEDGVGERGNADQVMPAVHGNLAGDQQRPLPVTVVDDLQQIAALFAAADEDVATGGPDLVRGIFPLVAKKIVDMVKARKVYAKWNHLKPKSFDRNLVVIGGGAGGLVSAYIAAAVKAKVTLIEAHKMGGDCLNYGCVPSKALIKSAKLAAQMKHGSSYGLSNTEAKFSFKAVMQRVHAVVKAIEPHDSVERYTGLGVEVLQGYAKIVNPWTDPDPHPWTDPDPSP